MPEKQILQTIRAYLGDDGLPRSEFGLRCLVGMLETGEAEMADFRDIGGETLVARVTEAKSLWDMQR